MRDDRGATSMDDLALLLVAVLAFTFFFSSLGASYSTRASTERGVRLQEVADSFLAAVLDDPRWSDGDGVLRADGLDAAGPQDMRGYAAGHAFRLYVRDLATDARWSFEEGDPHGRMRFATTNANLLGDRVDPARITATVWGP